MERYERINKWQEAKKEREKIRKMKDEAKNFIRTDQLKELKELAEKEPYYKEVLNHAIGFLKVVPDYLKAIN